MLDIPCSESTQLLKHPYFQTIILYPYFIVVVVIMYEMIAPTPRSQHRPTRMQRRRTNTIYNQPCTTQKHKDVHTIMRLYLPTRLHLPCQHIRPPPPDNPIRPTTKKPPPIGTQIPPEPLIRAPPPPRKTRYHLSRRANIPDLDLSGLTRRDVQVPRIGGPVQFGDACSVSGGEGCDMLVSVGEEGYGVVEFAGCEEGVLGDRESGDDALWGGGTEGFGVDGGMGTSWDRDREF